MMEIQLFFAIQKNGLLYDANKKKFTSDINRASMFSVKKEAEQYAPDSCEIVEIEAITELVTKYSIKNG